MFMLDNLVVTCSDAALGQSLIAIKRVMRILQIFVPIIAIVGLAKNLIQLMANPEDKKLANSIKNWGMALIIFFFLPVIINVVMNMVAQVFGSGAVFTFAECWTQAGI